MQHFKTLFAALLVVTAVVPSFSQVIDNWTWMNPRPQGNTINAIDFLDDNVGYASGAYGTILKTVDNGATWTKIYAGVSDQFLSLDFVDANTGYVGGPGQLLMKTTDGGQAWSTLQLPVIGQFDSLYYVMDIKFINHSIGYVLGFFQLECKIWKTTNGGASWEVQTTGGANYLFKLHFLDEHYGFGIGGALGGEIVRTTNGGAAWELIYEPDYAVTSVKFINAATGFVGCEEGRVYKTTDGGTTWNPMWSETSLDITSIHFINSTTGFGFGTGSVYTKTTNGGDNWHEFPLGVGSIRQYYDAEITPNGTIHAAGSYGAMIRSTNSGASFVSQPFVTEGYITGIEFVSATTGYAVAGFGPGDILKTTNAGETWVSQTTTYTLPIYGISFPSAETGYLAGSLTVYKTTNGGTNWASVYTSTTNEIFTDVFFVDENTGYVVGTYGKLLKTTNGGTNWVATTISIPGTGLNSVYFTDTNTGYAVGENGSAVKTTNGGATWSLLPVPSPSFTGLGNVFFSDGNTGYISSGSGIYKTTDAGGTWNQLNTPVGGFNNVQFRGNFGYAIGSSGQIIKSIDAGTSWIVQPTVTTNGLQALYFNSDDFVYAGGLLGTMIKTIPTELIPTSVSGNKNDIPQDFLLDQNYPNPFNPSTSIAFRIVDYGMVSLKVFDVLGREVATLVSEERLPGNYTVRWNASDLASGVYLARLESVGKVQFRRMLLLK